MGRRDGLSRYGSRDTVCPSVIHNRTAMAFNERNTLHCSDQNIYEGGCVFDGFESRLDTWIQPYRVRNEMFVGWINGLKTK